MQNSGIQIEDPIPADAAEIFFVQRQTWHESYIDRMSHEEIEHRFVDSPDRIEKIKEAIESDDRKFFIARDEGKIIGFISLTKTPKNEIKTFYVLENYQGQGLGKKLMTRALEWFGDEEVILETSSPDAQRFYERFGFEVQGKPEERKGFDTMQTLVRKAR